MYNYMLSAVMSVYLKGRMREIRTSGSVSPVRGRKEKGSNGVGDIEASSHD